ncbi:NAD-dependent epimerase/dehydratase family protein [Yinghuangia seranimata]|uniref:NAD-dependent epimerase/dehydratase family protein n=1 Tax=Yinghuangia seranimata TaxID=408067 RepID=UPI00248B4023|nr:NAD-dependent epimerase/dehydratase family protein [Yinghuangia seranimata]MDI2125972.1 reductase [Yinghuangia seranimata]
MRNVLVIGGSRYFGKILVERLRDAGDRVTVLNRGSAVPPAGVGHVVADRSDEAALAAALGAAEFDVVLDQVLYNPADAAVAGRVFTGRAGRYVMTSTMEVYDPATSAVLPAPVPGRPVAEDAVDPAGWKVDEELWRDPARVAALYDEATAYAEGKRQAEAVLARGAVALPYAAVRSAHVVGGGAQDFTGRLAHYVERIAQGRPVVVHSDPYETSFVGHRDVAAFLHAVAGSDAVGPVNACMTAPLSVLDLAVLVGERVGRAPVFAAPGEVPGEVPGEEVSPYSFDRYYAMDNRRAEALWGAAVGRGAAARFGRTVDTLAEAVDAAAREAGY